MEHTSTSIPDPAPFNGHRTPFTSSHRFHRHRWVSREKQTIYFWGGQGWTPSKIPSSCEGCPTQNLSARSRPSDSTAKKPSHGDHHFHARCRSRLYSGPWPLDRLSRHYRSKTKYPLPLLERQAKLRAQCVLYPGLLRREGCTLVEFQRETQSLAAEARARELHDERRLRSGLALRVQPHYRQG